MQCPNWHRTMLSWVHSTVHIRMHDDASRTRWSSVGSGQWSVVKKGLERREKSKEKAREDETTWHLELQTRFAAFVGVKGIGRMSAPTIQMHPRVLDRPILVLLRLKFLCRLQPPPKYPVNFNIWRWARTASVMCTWHGQVMRKSHILRSL